MRREKLPQSSSSLMNYWNKHLREYWIARLGGPPVRLDSHVLGGFETMSVVWDTPEKIRQLVTVQRGPDEQLTVEWTSLDCSDIGQAVGCF